MVPDCQFFLQHFIKTGVVKFIQGDVKTNLTQELIDKCNFFFIDSDHSVEFAGWYIDKILSKRKGITVSIDDIFFNEYYGEQEAQVIRKYLEDKDYVCLSDSHHVEALNKIIKVREDLGIGSSDHYRRSTSVLFKIP